MGATLAELPMGTAPTRVDRPRSARPRSQADAEPPALTGRRSDGCDRPLRSAAALRQPALSVPGPRRESDRSLLRAYADGDEGAFERLYRRHHARLHAHCLGLLLDDPSAAEDAVQEAFLRLCLRAARGVDETIGVGAWLSGEVTRRCRAQLRDGARTHLVDPHAPALLCIPD
ncbi:MAG: RNA polymerase sigma factor, partial [Acidimicrobiales bacterium]